MKIERKYLAHFICVGEDNYERLGKDLEEYSVEMSPQVESKKNILGERSVVISGYEKTASAAPYYAESGTGLHSLLQSIIDENKVLDDLKTDVVEAHLWEEQDGKFTAYREEVYIEVNSYGGDTTGYQIPFTLHYTGKKEKGTFDVETRKFTPEA